LNEQSRTRLSFTATEPEHCRTVADMRAGIDEVDQILFDLLMRRQAYTRKSAKLKKDEGFPLRDEARLAQQLARAKAMGAERGLSPLIVEPIYHVLVEQHIKVEAQELARLD
jgi:isochorismate pyruvate lyase